MPCVGIVVFVRSNVAESTTCPVGIVSSETTVWTCSPTKL